MAIKYYGKAKEFNQKELELGKYYVGIGSEYVSKNGSVYTCIRNSVPGELDVLCHFKQEFPLKMEGTIAIPKIWFFLQDVFGG